MSPRAAVFGILILLAIAMLGIGWVMATRGTSPPALVGLLLGAALGGLNLLVESLSLAWALRKKPSATLAVSLGGFVVRLVLVCVLTLVFAKSASVDAVMFALAYVTSFLAFVGLQIWAVSRVLRRTGSPGEGDGMNEAPIVAAGDIMSHLAPRYEWHWPGLDLVHKPGEHSGFSVDLGSLNSWVKELTGVNPDITTHIVMMGFAAFFLFLFFIPIARAFVLVPGGFRNFLEPVLLYIRDEMVYPWLGEKDGRKFLPYFWTIFFFILCCNLIGLLPAPFGITATGNFNITGALALITLFTGIIAGSIKKGPGKYWLGWIPHGVPGFLAPLVLAIEIVGLITKHFALMVRLFANMTAGHAILAVLAMWTSLAPAFIPIRAIQAVGSTAMILFEIFIALVQAYIFTILSAIYISLSLAEEH